MVDMVNQLRSAEEVLMLHTVCEQVGSGSSVFPFNSDFGLRKWETDILNSYGFSKL